MSRKEKLIKKLLSHPKDFSFSELESLLSYCEYNLSQKGKTSGSRVKFDSDIHQPILLHKPHGRKDLLDYQINQVVNILEEEDLL